MIATGSEGAARRQLAGTEEEARAALAVLEPGARRFLQAHLRRRIPEDPADLVQETLARVWSARRRYQDLGEASWYAFLKRIADRCAVDLIRQRGADVALLCEELPGEELTDLESLFSHGTAAGCLQQADGLWLELTPGLARAAHQRRLLATQLFFLDRAGWVDILDALNQPAGLPHVNREELDDWLSDPSVQRHLAYSELYVDGDGLAAHLLGLGEDTPAAVLDQLARQAAQSDLAGTSPRGWTWLEVQVLLWRVRHGLSVDQIATRADCPVSPEDIQELGDRLVAEYPFTHRLARLREALEEHGSLAGPVLSHLGLWQRLAFQYRYLDELPLRDIHDRIAAPAREAGVEVTSGMLNMWLSGGRLLKRLARRIQTHGAAESSYD